MTAKLLFFRDFARSGAAFRTPADKFLRHAAGLSVSSRTPVAARQIPRLRPRLECQWTISPVTSALRAHWVVRPAADRCTGARAGEFIEDRRCLRPELAIAGNPGALRLAA
jgi:hypothetical protein